MAQSLGLAIVGGSLSLLSTGFGAQVAPRFLKMQEPIGSTRRWLDFALGLMLSSVAFSLIGPEILHANSTKAMLLVAASAAGGVLLISALHLFTEESTAPASKLMALALIFHNFPEGMGSGASLAGMPLAQALPLQVGLIAQNLAEGAMLAACFVGFGWSWRKAIVGSWLSGVVEFLGAVTAGVGLEWSRHLLSPLLAFAGGAMLMSVVSDLRERGQWPEFRPFLSGLMIVPFLNYVL